MEAINCTHVTRLYLCPKGEKQVIPCMSVLVYVCVIFIEGSPLIGASALVQGTSGMMTEQSKVVFLFW